MFAITGIRLEKFKKLVGKKIQTRRKQVGFKTQEALAKALGTDQTRVARWESGRHLPDAKFQDLLQKILKVSSSFFDSVDGPIVPNKSIANITVEELVEALTDAQTAKAKPESELARLIENLNGADVERLSKILNNLESKEVTLLDFPETKFEASALRRLRAYKEPKIFEELDHILETQERSILSPLGFAHLARKAPSKSEPVKPQERLNDKDIPSLSVSRKGRKSL